MAQGRKKTDERVAAYYLGLTDDERQTLDGRLEAAGRKLTDLRLTAKGTPDERLLVPIATYKEMAGRLRSRQRNKDGTVVKFGIPPDELSRKGMTKAAGLASRRYSKRLEQGQTLQTFIQKELSDGLELAHFYIDIIRMRPEDCRKSGVFMNHKLNAATWLGERGWGKPKGDDEKSGQFTINVVNHAEALTQPPPVKVIAAEVETSDVSAESDVGKDELKGIEGEVGRLEGFTFVRHPSDVEELKNGKVEIEQDFDLTEVR